MTNIGKNVSVIIEGEELVVRINLTKDFGKSKSGKTIIVASSEGNVSLPEPYKNIKMGLNVYK